MPDTDHSMRPEQPRTEAGEALVAAFRRAADAVTRGPARPPTDLAHAAGAITEWYHTSLGYPAPHLGNDRRTALLDEAVRTHIALRREWEAREAQAIVSWMTEVAGVAAATAVPAGQTRRQALLIDDSSDILVTVGAFLEAADFDVAVASSGEEALQILATRPVDLLVTDHAMPGMTGRDLVMEACQNDPGLRALVISGYPDLHELQSLPPSVHLLAKPFRRAEFFARIRRLFDTTGPAVALAGPSLCGSTR